MIKEKSDFFQNAKFFPILNIYNSPDDQCVQICINSKFDAILQLVIQWGKVLAGLNEMRCRREKILALMKEILIN